jgi:hypothetical protein
LPVKLTPPQREFSPTEGGFSGLISSINRSAVTTFKVTVQTSAGALQIPSAASAITLGGRQSKVIVTDYAFGKSRALYSTASVLFAGVIDGRDVLFLHGDQSQEHEVALTLGGQSNGAASNPNIQVTNSNSGALTNATVINIVKGTQGVVTIWDSTTQLVMFADSVTAGTFWAPTIAGASSDPLKNFWGLGTNQTVLIGGPYLVRTAGLSNSGAQLELTGDLKSDATLTIIGPRTIRSVSWNGQVISSSAKEGSRVTSIGGFTGQISTARSLVTITIPALTGWKYKDSLPEVVSGFDDSTWTIANKTTTNIPSKPYYGDGRILYGCDYGL